MKLKPKALVIIVSLALVLLVPLLVFFVRPPVLVVTDLSFISLYGQSRIRRETLMSSLVLFRRVKAVSVADDAGSDIVPFAVSEVSSSPFCVLFPLRFAQAARLYRESNPRIPVVLLEGRHGGGDFTSVGDNPNDYFVYQTDIENDFFRAGLAAAALDMGKNGKIAVFLESRIRTQAREAFLRALNSLEKPPEALFYTSFSQFSDIPDISCVVLAGVGAEYMEKEAGVPVIFMTWIDPSLVPVDVVLVVNDSPWVQAVQAVRMVKASMGQGLIQSKFQVLNGKSIDRNVLRKLKKQG